MFHLFLCISQVQVAYIGLARTYIGLDNECLVPTCVHLYVAVRSLRLFVYQSTSIFHPNINADERFSIHFETCHQSCPFVSQVVPGVLLFLLSPRRTRM